MAVPLLELALKKDLKVANNGLINNYRLAHDEASRQAFVGTLKSYLNGPLERELDDRYSEIRAVTGDEKTAQDAFKQDGLFKLWQSTVYSSQDMMWETVGETVDRLHSSYLNFWHDLDETGGAGGTLELDPDLALPEPIGSHEIHRQPGGYFYASEKDDLIAPLMYFGSRELYMNAKGARGGAVAGAAAISKVVVATIKQKAADLKPTRILDMGCGTGSETREYKHAFPQADVFGVDISAPFVKFAHLWAEAHGDPIAFRQANAAATGYPDGHFDLIVSTIMFHETSNEVLPQILEETRRLLAPGGLVVFADVPFQIEKLTERQRVTSDWQVKHNGEPFWTGYGNVDLRKSLLAAGFAEDEAFAEYANFGALDMMIFGAKRNEVSK